MGLVGAGFIDRALPVAGNDGRRTAAPIAALASPGARLGTDRLPPCSTDMR